MRVFSHENAEHWPKASINLQTHLTHSEYKFVFFSLNPSKNASFSRQVKILG